MYIPNKFSPLYSEKKTTYGMLYSPRPNPEPIDAQEGTDSDSDLIAAGFAENPEEGKPPSHCTCSKQFGPCECGYYGQFKTTAPSAPEKMKVTREKLFDIHYKMTEAALATMEQKNRDYAHDTDVFRNFRMFGGLGILVRISDKLARLRTFEERGTFSVTDESLRDTIEDAINYLVIYYAYKQEEK